MDKMDNTGLSEQTAKSKNHKKEYKFNIIDIILILVVVTAAAALIYIMGGNSLFENDDIVDIEYKIEITQIKNQLLPYINQIVPGTRVTDSVRSYFLGEVQDVKIEDFYTNSVNLEKGVVERKPYPDYSKVTITVRAVKAERGKSGYSVNGKIICVGERIDFRTPYFVSYGNCVSVDPISGNDANNAE